MSSKYLPEKDSVEQLAEVSGGAPGSGFAEFGLHLDIMEGVVAAGFVTPSPIQKMAIPHVLEGKDLIGQAHTGTGKTAAFGLPMMSKLRQTGKVEILVITPTRELCNQVSDELHRLGQFIGVRTVAVYGGQPYGRQIDLIRRGSQIVVATPGRLLDLLDGGRISEVFEPWAVVLDEADEMLDMGFIEDVEKILRHLPKERQTLLFSATMPKPIQTLAEKFMKQPFLIRAEKSDVTNQDIEQHYYIIDDHEREIATIRLIDSLDPTRAMVFCRTRREVDELATVLAGQGVPAQALHGDMEQAMRERVLKAFRRGDFTVLVATDVAARGLDIPEVSHVLNYHIPYDSDSYVHRIGRTGRAGRKGVAITFVTPSEYHGLRRIQSKVGKMELNLVPTHSDIREQTMTKLMDEVRKQVPNRRSEELMELLLREYNLPDIAARLASLLTAKEEVSGPDKIGVTGARLEALRNPQTAGKGAGKFGGGRFGGGRKFGGGAGERGERGERGEGGERGGKRFGGPGRYGQGRADRTNFRKKTHTAEPLEFWRELDANLRKKSGGKKAAPVVKRAKTGKR